MSFAPALTTAALLAVLVVVSAVPSNQDGCCFPDHPAFNFTQTCLSGDCAGRTVHGVIKLDYLSDNWNVTIHEVKDLVYTYLGKYKRSYLVAKNDKGETQCVITNGVEPPHRCVPKSAHFAGNQTIGYNTTLTRYHGLIGRDDVYFTLDPNHCVVTQVVNVDHESMRATSALEYRDYVNKQHESFAVPAACVQPKSLVSHYDLLQHHPDLKWVLPMLHRSLPITSEM